MVGHKGQVVGYVRVSAADQNPARQLEGIGEVDRLFDLSWTTLVTRGCFRGC